MGQNGGPPVLRASELERAARGGASGAARVPGQVRGKQGEGREAGTAPSAPVRPGLSPSDPRSSRCMRTPGTTGPTARSPPGIVLFCGSTICHRDVSPLGEPADSGTGEAGLV